MRRTQVSTTRRRSARWAETAGTTLGAQRLIVFQEAARIWGQALDSTVPITVLSHFTPLTCDSSGATLGSAGPTNIFASDDPALDGGVPPSVFPRQKTWYVSAETQRFAGEAAAVGHRDRPEQLRHPGPLQLHPGRPQRHQLQRLRLVLRAGQPAREQARPPHRRAPRVRARARFHQPDRPRLRELRAKRAGRLELRPLRRGHRPPLERARCRRPQGLRGQRSPGLGRPIGEDGGAVDSRIPDGLPGHLGAADPERGEGLPLRLCDVQRADLRRRRLGTTRGRLDRIRMHRAGPTGTARRADRAPRPGRADARRWLHFRRESAERTGRRGPCPDLGQQRPEDP